MVAPYGVTPARTRASSTSNGCQKIAWAIGVASCADSCVAVKPGREWIVM